MRDAREREYGRIADLNVEAYAEFGAALGPAGWAAMEANLRTVAQRAGYSDVLVAERDGLLVGAVTYTSAGRRPPSTVGLIKLVPAQWAYVGARSIGLVTRTIMEPAQRLYATLGFRRRDDLHDAEDGFVSFELPLHGAA